MAHIIKNTKKFGRLIRNRRIEKNLTQQELGDLCEMSKNAISKIELGQSGPSEANLKKLAKVLGISTQLIDEPKTESENIMEAIEGIDKKTERILDKISNVDKIAPFLSELQDKVNKLENKIHMLKSSEETKHQKPISVQAHNTILDVVKKYESAGEEIGIFDNLLDSARKRKLMSKIYVDCCNSLEKKGVDPNFEISDSWGESFELGDLITDEVYKFACGDQSLSDTYDKIKDILKSINEEEEENEDTEEEDEE